MDIVKTYWHDGGFYRSDVHPEIPENAVEITEDLWKELLAAQSDGKRIVTGHDGIPVAEEPPKRPLAELKEEAYNTLWNNYKTYQQTYVDAEDLTLAVVCANGGSQKGAAIQMWVMNLWAQYYSVKDAITAAETEDVLSTINLTADAFGQPPYTIRELNEEARRNAPEVKG